MKDIVIEVEAALDAGIEDELIKLGEKCDVDLDHVPFKEFKVNVVPTKELWKKMENDLVTESVERRIATLPYVPDMLERTKIFNEVKEKLKAGKERENDALTSLEVEFTDYGLNLKSKYSYNAEILINKRKFNVLDKDLNMDVGKVDLHELAVNGDRKEIVKEMEENISLIFGILAFMQTTKEEVKFTRVKREPSNKSGNINKTSKKKKNNKTYLYNKVYKLNKDTLTRATSKAAAEEGIKDSKRTYHVASWYVRGHWRHYKNGKDIWIEAQFRHPQKELKEDSKQKIYKITRI